MNPLHALAKADHCRPDIEVDPLDDAGRTPLAAACQAGQVGAAKLLLEIGGAKTEWANEVSPPIPQYPLITAAARRGRTGTVK